MARVLLRNVTKQYGKIVAVDGLSLEARDGEFLVLLGPSGCGKSTVLRLIAGLETLTSGDIYIGERLVNRVPTHDRNAVMMFESPTYALYPHMTAYNNVAFGLRIQEQRRGGQQTEEPGSSMGKEVLPGNNRNKRDVKEEREGIIRKRIEQAATRLGLQGHLGRKPSELSAGQQQSVALERAMLRTPEVFLMDDPLSNLDRLLHAASRAELRDLHRQLNATTIYVTHDQMDAMSLAQRIAVMKDGVLQQLGVPQAVYERPANTFVATFVGSPPMNLLPVHLEEDGGQLFAQAGSFRLPVPPHYAQLLGVTNAQVLLGIRPQNIRESRSGDDPEAFPTVTAQVEVREYTGSDLFLHLAAGPQQFVARVDERIPAKPGQAIEVAFDMNTMHAFDERSGHSLL